MTRCWRPAPRPSTAARVERRGRRGRPPRRSAAGCWARPPVIQPTGRPAIAVSVSTASRTCLLDRERHMLMRPAVRWLRLMAGLDHGGRDLRLRASAVATARMPTTILCSNRRRSRHTPRRLPYSTRIRPAGQGPSPREIDIGQTFPTRFAMQQAELSSGLVVERICSASCACPGHFGSGRRLPYPTMSRG